MSAGAMQLWVKETHREALSMGFKVARTLFSGQSACQRIDIVETADHGRMLLNDGVVMLSERDEFIYHEMLAHVPLMIHPAPRRVLVVGGGDGGTAREVLKHDQVEQVVLVEIDPMVVEACRRHLPRVSSAMDDPRLQLRIEDGAKFVQTCRAMFDVVLIDSTDPVGPGAVLFSENFYRAVARRLAPEGLMVTQAESPFYDNDLQLRMLAHQRPFFQRLHLYLFPTLTYPGGLWSFALAARQDRCPVDTPNEERFEAARLETRYYSPAIHRSAFALPPFLQQALGGVLDPLPAGAHHHERG